jgi:hypothetical protein
MNRLPLLTQLLLPLVAGERAVLVREEDGRWHVLWTASGVAMGSAGGTSRPAQSI